MSVSSVRPSLGVYQSLENAQIIVSHQTTRSALHQMTSNCCKFIYAPTKWLFDTIYYYLFGYGEGAQVPQGGYRASYTNKDMKEVYSATNKILKNSASYNYKGEKINLNPMLNRSIAKTEKQGVFYYSNKPYQNQGYETKIEVVNRDAMYVGLGLKKQGYNPALLNPANAHQPGGGYKWGVCAMEEDICRRSGLSLAIDAKQGNNPHNFYPLKYSQLLYTPDCPFFRYGRDRYYALMPKPETLSVITSAAIDLEHDHEYKIDTFQYINTHQKFLDETEKRVYAQLWMAAKKGHDAVVLTAFGCGAFHNDPKEIAEIYKKVIDTKFAGVFKNITFAIVDDHNAKLSHNPEGNFKPFYEAFLRGSK